MAHKTPCRHRQRPALRGAFARLYGRGMARMNLRIPDDLYALIVREARKAGITPASYVRESVAWRLGRTEADELAARVAALEAEIAQLKNPRKTGVP